MFKYTDRYKTRTVYEKMSTPRAAMALPLYMLSLVLVKLGYATSDLADSLLGTRTVRYVDKD